MNRLPERPHYSSQFVPSIGRNEWHPDHRDSARWSFDLISLAISHGYFPDWRVSTRNLLVPKT